MKLSCKHKYKAVEQITYRTYNYLTFLECEKCGKRKTERTSFFIPYQLMNIIHKWEIGKFDLKTTMVILGQDVL